MAFVQRFGSALQLTPHFHVLVPEAVFEEMDEAELRLHPLPRPTDADVGKLAVTVSAWREKPSTKAHRRPGRRARGGGSRRWLAGQPQGGQEPAQGVGRRRLTDPALVAEPKLDPPAIE